MKGYTAITRWTLWQRRWSSLWWIIGIVGFMVLILAFYPPFRDQAVKLDQTINKQIPSSARAFISDTPNYFSPVGYLSSQIYYLVLPILLSILSIGAGSSLIAKEESTGTIELLLARPLSRAKLLAGKFSAGGLILTAVSLFAFISALIMAHIVNLPVGTLPLFITTLDCLVMAAAFGSIAFMITTIKKARRASIGLAVLIALGGYIINSLASTASALKWPARFMPFHYYHASDMLKGHYRWEDFAVMGGIIAACLIISWVSFRRRDIIV